MKKGSTMFLRAAALFFGVVVLGLCVFALPAGIRSAHAGAYRPILWGMYVPALPFFVAIYQALKLLKYIDRNRAFSEASVRALKSITYCAFAISGLYAIGLPYIYQVGAQDDAPGVVLLGFVFTFAPLVIGVFAAVLRKLLQSAIAIKSENDLTV